MRTSSLFLLLAAASRAIPSLAEEASAEATEVSAAGGCRNPEVSDGIRREWRTFSSVEKAAYITAVNCLARKPHTSALKPTYPRSNIPSVNINASMVYALTTRLRWFVNAHIQQLKAQCGYRGVMPYWDWSQDSLSLNTSGIFSTNSVTGLGGFGDPLNDYQITTGGFSNMTVAYPVYVDMRKRVHKHRIRRQFTPFPYLDWYWLQRPNEAANATITKAYIDAAINGYVGDFVGFQNATEKAQAFHPNIHMILGGDMAGTCPTAAGPSCTGAQEPGQRQGLQGGLCEYIHGPCVPEWVSSLVEHHDCHPNGWHVPIQDYPKYAEHCWWGFVLYLSVVGSGVEVAESELFDFRRISNSGIDHMRGVIIITWIVPGFPRDARAVESSTSAPAGSCLPTLGIGKVCLKGRSPPSHPLRPSPSVFRRAKPSLIYSDNFQHAPKRHCLAKCNTCFSEAPTVTDPFVFVVSIRSLIPTTQDQPERRYTSQYPVPTASQLSIYTPTSKREFGGLFSPAAAPRHPPAFRDSTLNPRSSIQTTSTGVSFPHTSPHPFGLPFYNPPEQMSDVALAPLIAGNAKWAAEVREQYPTFFADAAKGQSPKVLWIGCADSRVPESTVLGCKPGEIFVHRNIANQFHPEDDSALAVLTYAVENLGVEHTAACHAAAQNISGAASPATTPLARWLNPLTQLAASLASGKTDSHDTSTELSTLVEANVRKQVDNVVDTDVVQRAWASGKQGASSVMRASNVFSHSTGTIKDLKVTANPPAY
ncbi:carbonic anhydrase domain-containing protein [Rhizoctonia solani AG-1 IA]|uniref:carbonic anhydrase n=1 Tax=Thanatephorus cucumeris (strain AG1-IA) TaxID=983506 RepID=L8WLD5_THACA|nr:carbonic anhydrase domain-containing protein [Rhizoctonia solani AG-1 IA]